MEYRLRDIRQLSDFLEAEASGQPFDRGQARCLALKLAEHHPEIRDTMRRIHARLLAVDGHA